MSIILVEYYVFTYNETEKEYIPILGLYDYM